MLETITALAGVALTYQVGQGISAALRGWKHQFRQVRRGHRWIVRKVR